MSVNVNGLSPGNQPNEHVNNVDRSRVETEAVIQREKAVRERVREEVREKAQEEL